MIHWQKIDVDPEENLLLALTNMTRGLPQQRQEILAVLRQQFTPETWGYLLVTQDPPIPEA